MAKEQKNSSVAGDFDSRPTYVDAMRVVLQMIDMCDTYSELLQMVDNISGIVRDDKIKSNFDH